MVTITQTDQLSDTTALESSKDLRLFKSVDDKSRSVQAVADAGQKKKEKWSIKRRDTFSERLQLFCHLSGLVGRHRQL